MAKTSESKETLLRVRKTDHALLKELAEKEDRTMTAMFALLIKSYKKGKKS